MIIENCADRCKPEERIYLTAESQDLGAHLRTRWLRDWLQARAWPLWLAHGVDWKRRGFHEHLDLTSLQCRAEFRRLRVAARQTYVFSKAASHGVPDAREAVMLGLAFLQGPARLAEGGFAWRFDLDNRPIDRTRDLYDHAFVLLAFAAAAGVVGAESLRPEALALVDYICQNFAHAEGGYEESIPPAMPRRQNPHMHFLEALLAAHDAFADEIFFARAEELVAIFLDRFFQAEGGALPEYFDTDLAPQREAGRFPVEPGHHYEWVWLLDWYARSAAATGRPGRPELRHASDARRPPGSSSTRRSSASCSIRTPWRRKNSRRASGCSRRTFMRCGAWSAISFSAPMRHSALLELGSCPPRRARQKVGT